MRTLNWFKRIVFGALELVLAAVLAGISLVALAILAIGLAMLGTGSVLTLFGYVTLRLARRGLS